VEANIMGPEYEPPRDLRALETVFLDSEPFIGFEFRARKYRTMMAEDWGRGFGFEFFLISSIHSQPQSMLIGM
jgi:hypothetical protein